MDFIILKARLDNDNSNILRVYCDRCKCEHIHGTNELDTFPTHRTAHCPVDQANRYESYYIELETSKED